MARHDDLGTSASTVRVRYAMLVRSITPRQVAAEAGLLAAGSPP
jgi:hypothetical protein